MRIGIDCRLYDESGIGRYIRNLIRELGKLDSKNTYFLFLLKKDFHKCQVSGNFIKVVANFKWYTFSEQVRFPALLNKYRLDLVHFPHLNIPILYQRKFIVTIHDLILQQYFRKDTTTHGLFTYQLKRLGLMVALKSALVKSTKILTPSNFVKNSIVSSWGVSPDKIAVTYEAVGDDIVKISKKMPTTNSLKTLAKYAVKQPYIFYVGNAYSHKNIEGLIKAFMIIRRDRLLTLVLSGGDHYFWDRLKQIYPHQDIIFTGFISDQEMVALYKNASCFVMPSLEEGFGLPILEAMACGCPVVSSSGGSLPEIGGEAVLYFDPSQVLDMVEKISSVLNNAKLRLALIHKGNRRYKHFSWEKLARQTWEEYTK